LGIDDLDPQSGSSALACMADEKVPLSLEVRKIPKIVSVW
jgi:hypothetical protein